ncbi:MAG: DUF4136 domain-containing protein [Cyclobacteriaceae bacterium]|nr:DUF4136 domain-containing protein [Cyclobacteriaceae bacterium]
MRKKLIALMLVGSQFALWGCYLEGPDYTEELDLVYSNYNNKYDFASQGTYSIPDQIVKVTGDPTGPPEYISPIYATPILNEIKAQMTALGWQEVDVNANPDVQLMPAAWTTTTIVGGYYGGYYCWWYPYYCGGGWYYPYTPVSSYSTGTLLLTMVDPNLQAIDGSLPVVWTSAMNGLLSSGTDINRVKDGIKQAFKQSPYLKTN